MKPSSNQSRYLVSGRRSGSMILELLVSAALLASLLVIVNQSLVGLRRQSRIVDRRFVAQQVLENLMEECLRQPWAELSTESVQELSLPEFATHKLPQAAIAGEVLEENDPVPAKRILLRLNWMKSPGQNQKPLVLTAWSFPPTESDP